jgi:hypothetical protein
VEIECGLDRIHTSLRVWEKKWGGDIKSDGSVHVDGKSYSNQEIISSPARGEKLVEQIQEMCKSLHASGAAVDRSCGYHCHVDVRDMNDAQILAVQRAYIRAEPALYGLVARSRRDNTYSKALGFSFGAKRLRELFKNAKSTAEKVDRFDAMFYGSLERAKDCKINRRRSESRYHGLNVSSIPIHGTIEFRLHQGTVNPTKILMWAAICSALVEYGRTHTDEDVASIRGSAISVLEKVIGDPEVVAWSRARRIYFHQQERTSRGLKPARIPQKVLADIRNVPNVPSESGENEQSHRTGRNSWEGRDTGM